MNFQGWGYREMDIASKMLSKFADQRFPRDAFYLSNFSIEMDPNTGEVYAIDSVGNILVLDDGELVVK